MGRKVKLTITESRCRSGFHRKGDEFIIDEDRTICPPICMELWHYAYPYIWALLNGAEDDRPDGSRGKETNVICPDEGRVHLHIEVIEEKAGGINDADDEVVYVYDFKKENKGH